MSSTYLKQSTMKLGGLKSKKISQNVGKNEFKFKPGETATTMLLVVDNSHSDNTSENNDVPGSLAQGKKRAGYPFAQNTDVRVTEYDDGPLRKTRLNGEFRDPDEIESLDLKLA